MHIDTIIPRLLITSTKFSDIISQKVKINCGCTSDDHFWNNIRNSHVSSYKFPNNQPNFTKVLLVPKIKLLMPGAARFDQVS